MFVFLSVSKMPRFIWEDGLKNRIIAVLSFIQRWQQRCIKEIEQRRHKDTE
jgi:hypothetical protein